MVVPTFGFSFGDILAGISFIKKIITALHDGAGAKQQYRRVIVELTNLEFALNEVRHLKVKVSQTSQKTAIEQTAIQCHEIVVDFLERIAKYSATLGAQTTSSKWSLRGYLHKIQWAMCQEDAIDKLRAEIMVHKFTIDTLLHL